MAKATGISRATIGRLEHGRLDSLTLLRAAELAAVLGLELSIRTYPGPRVVRDAAQIRLIQRLMARLGAAWTWEFEVPLGLERDQRAWDARATHISTGATFVVEAVTRLTDVQGTLRRINLKQRDAGSPRVVLLLAETHANTLMQAEARPILRSAFSVNARTAFHRWSTGADLGADAVVVL